jgi:3'-phosphoadenosine 5'-phosphosulfate sulfotransferase (PAPS reductase)/FAD synthetase
MKRFISFSGGVESTTMCILYGRGAKAIWCNPGWEHQPMIERVDFCEKMLKEIHDGDFEIIRVTPKVKVKGQVVETLQSCIALWQYMPNVRQRYCTDRFKIQPIEKFLKEQGECELMIGFNADEEPGGVDRVGNFAKLKNVNYTYPLFNDGFTRDMCEEKLNELGLHPNFPPYMQRGGCVGCFFKSEREYKAMYFMAREEFMSTLKLEESIQDKRSKFFTIGAFQKPLRHLMNVCNQELALWGSEAILDMYKKVKPTQSCGAFCHR